MILAGAHRRVSRAFATLVTAVAALGGTTAEGGHEPTFYPSFYPQEIRIDTLDPALAAGLVRGDELHAYVGGDPFAGRPLPPGVRAVDSLGSYVVLSFHPAEPVARDAAARCAAAAGVAARLAGAPDFVFHPYPVTPYDPDYLEHYDRVEAARRTYRNRRAGGSSLRIQPGGAFSDRLTAATESAKTWEARVEEVEVAGLLASRGAALTGPVGPPWLKAGWFHAWLLLSGSLDGTEKRPAETIYRRLVTGGYAGAIERANLERTLIGHLTRDCGRVVLGYTVRREIVNDEYSAGVENVAGDSLTGLDSAIFVRTVKLKDFPWNGWLRVGVPARAAAAWNPVAGFTDGPGRLIWAALGDPALLPAPYSGRWIPNRVTASAAPPRGSAGRIEIPDDALVPEPGTGALRPAGPGRRAETAVTYRALTSPFHDGTRMSVADVLYPFSFAYRWGTRPAGRDAESDPAIAESTALMREWLAALRVADVETATRTYGEDLTVIADVPVVEIYLRHPAPDPDGAAAIAPPWSAVPWHVTALMEEAVRQGLAAFSEGEAARRGVAWLDLAREPALDAALASLVERFRAEAWVPPALSGLVSADDARARWTRLKQFHDTYLHFLVTNGPYRLQKWAPASVTLEVVRDLAYPLGVGAFDRYPIPLKSYVARIADRGDRLEIQADVEQIEKFQRSYQVTRVPLARAGRSRVGRETACRYVVVGLDGSVRALGLAARSGGRFVVPLGKGRLAPGVYTVLVALSVGDNTVGPEVRLVRHRVRS
jgi:hypothetical protein